MNIHFIPSSKPKKPSLNVSRLHKRIFFIGHNTILKPISTNLQVLSFGPYVIPNLLYKNEFPLNVRISSNMNNFEYEDMA